MKKKPIRLNTIFAGFFKVKMGRTTNNFIFASLIFVFLIFQAEAFTLNLASEDLNVSIDDIISVFPEINIPSNERIPLDSIEVVFDGSVSRKCKFDPEGNTISGCLDFNVDVMQLPDFNEGSLNFSYGPENFSMGEGFGYTNGMIKYNLTIPSSVLGEGLHSVKMIISLDSEEFQKFGNNILVYIPVEIANEEISDNCIVLGDIFTVQADVSGSFEEVFLKLEYPNGTIKNISLGNADDGTYLGNINSSQIGQGDMKWTFFARDVLGQLIYGQTTISKINSLTILTKNPSEPDGENSWYVSQPLFSLSNPDAESLFYRWNGNYFTYSGEFSLGGAPNQGNITGGVIVLKYWGNYSCNQEESQKEFSGKYDFTDPIIRNLQPSPNQTVYNFRPQISALLEEKYQSNSGINLSLVDLFLDGVEVGASINKSGTLDAKVVYTPTVNLSVGVHTVSINATDKAGRSSSLSWSFIIGEFPELDMDVFSPLEGVFNSRRVPLNISTNAVSKEIGFINYNDRDPKFRKLCSDCSEYGNLKKKQISLGEGKNRLEIIAISNDGVQSSKMINLTIDSKKPVISKTNPKKGFAFGRFSVEFREANPKELVLDYGSYLVGFRKKTLDIENCLVDRDKYTCETIVDLDDFDQQEIVYSFSLTDVANNTVKSKDVILKVDFTPPIVTSQDIDLRGRYIDFFFRIDEVNFDKVRFIDYFDRNPNYRPLCSSLTGDICRKSQRFSEGDHNVTVEVLDDAGNVEYAIKDFLFST